MTPKNYEIFKDYNQQTGNVWTIKIDGIRRVPGWATLEEAKEFFNKLYSSFGSNKSVLGTSSFAVKYIDGLCLYELCQA